MLLKVIDLGTVVATRKLTLGEKGEIVIRIGQPFVPPNYGGNFCCPYQIEGVGDGAIRYGSGIDSLQALYIALINISTDLYSSVEAQAGMITWEGDRRLGLPFAEGSKDFVQRGGDAPS